MNHPSLSARARCWGAALALVALSFVTPARAARAVDVAVVTPSIVTLLADPAVVCPESSMVYVTVSHPSDSCLAVTGITRDSLDGIVMTRNVPYNQPCTGHNGDFRYALGHFNAGLHVVPIRVRLFVRSSPDTGWIVSEFVRAVAFRVDSTCPPPPPPPPSEPRDLRVLIGQPSPCLTCPPVACPGEPVPVKILATLANSCDQYLGALLVPGAGRDGRDLLQLRFRTWCPDSLRPCSMLAALIRDSLFLPAHAAGARQLELRVLDVACADTVPSSTTKLLAYTVLDSCDAPPPPPPVGNCVFPFLQPAMPITANVDICDAHVPRGTVAPVLFAARSEDRRLSGIQGSVGTPMGPVVIDHLEAAGVAAGMHLSTQPQEDGSVNFVMWAEHGAPIPAGVWAPVLKVFVRADSTQASADFALLGVSMTAASDSAGHSLPLCAIETFAPVLARLCLRTPSPAGCDVNGDSLINVADLVRMVRCWYHPAECGDSLTTRPDCNGDGAFHLDDVLCCARTILGGHRDSLGSVPANVHFAFGQPQLVNDILTLPLTMSGGTEVGGALLRVNYPVDRYEAGSWNADGLPAGANGAIGTTNWTVVTEPGSADILLGLLRMGDGASDAVTMTLQLKLRPGQQHGGTVSIAESELTAPDGGLLEVPLASVIAQLPSNPAAGITSIELAPARPNPAGGRTTFAVSLPAAATVDLAMYDLAGRRVATLWRGLVGAGVREFAWEPGAVRSGVYFARLVVNGEVRTTRVVLRQAP